ncbi:zinc finger MYM-type protein 6 [Octopus bimaculoides]|uniref:zinc finger MYM-type protein 6 n=1 Tax=Octopus bimaculoides TaxID=37653 RepID=UPI00071CD657|nr:zinc finger MYM-type protein 6 [Octopus bimaculoides]|eukprot:XP_014777801.1 PREDICTED: zinc finger MYM-type protein 6-like [Octopus bimaculoides]
MSSKPHTIGEQLILPAVKEVLKMVLRKVPEPIIKDIPLSNSSVQRRVDEMAEDVEDQLCTILKKTEFTWTSLLCQLCFKNDEDFQSLLLHTEAIFQYPGQSVVAVITAAVVLSIVVPVAALFLLKIPSVVTMGRCS